jgi:hypothetical protein
MRMHTVDKRLRTSSLHSPSLLLVSAVTTWISMTNTAILCRHAHTERGGHQVRAVRRVMHGHMWRRAPRRHVGKRPQTAARVAQRQTEMPGAAMYEGAAYHRTAVSRGRITLTSPELAVTRTFTRWGELAARSRAWRQCRHAATTKLLACMHSSTSRMSQSHNGQPMKAVRVNTTCAQAAAAAHPISKAARGRAQRMGGGRCRGEGRSAICGGVPC